MGMSNKNVFMTRLYIFFQILFIAIATLEINKKSTRHVWDIFAALMPSISVRISISIVPLLH